MPVTKRFLDTLRDKLKTNNQTETINIWIERIRLGIFLENYNGNTSYSITLDPIEPVIIGLLQKEISDIFTEGIDFHINRISETGVFIRAQW